MAKTFVAKMCVQGSMIASKFEDEEVWLGFTAIEKHQLVGPSSDHLAAVEDLLGVF